MAPQKGQKRAAPKCKDEDEPALKVLKQHGIPKSKYNAIISAIRHPLAEGLSNECREMLVSSVLTSLCIAKDERHEIQTGLVEMIGQTIEEVMGKLKGIAEKSTAELADFDQAHKALTDTAENASRELAARTEVATTQSATLAGVKADVSAAEKALTEKQDEQRKGLEQTSALNEEKADVATAISSDFATVVSGEGGEAELKKHVDTLVSLSTKLALEESLLEAMPAVLLKKPEARGTFDKMVFDQLDECLNKRAKDLDAQLVAQTSADQDRATEVAASEAALEAAKGLQEQAAEAYRVAQAQRDEAQTQRDAADLKVATSLPEQKRMKEAAEMKQFDVDSFGLTLKHFEALRDRLSKVAAAAALASSEAAEVAVEASEGGA